MFIYRNVTWKKGRYKRCAGYTRVNRMEKWGQKVFFKKCVKGELKLNIVQESELKSVCTGSLSCQNNVIDPTALHTLSILLAFPLFNFQRLL
jgi:hypothetical protein